MEYLLHHVLSRSAAAHPDREAVRMDNQSLTYKELDRVTNQVASQLLALGVRRGDRVGIYVHKSPASVIAVFGIMKAGAAYVPLDPNAPAKRLAYITRDCGIQIVITSAAKVSALDEFLTEGTALTKAVLLDDASDGGSVQVPGLDIIPSASVRQQPESPPAAEEMVDADLAYILYTSGSTGVPKGVMIAHRTILTFVRWSVDEFKMTPEDRVTSHAPLHFDLSTFDLYATLHAGGAIILLTETLSSLPVKLADVLQNERVTITYMVPSILSLMSMYGKLDGHQFPHLRHVLFAGEVFPVKYLRKLAAALPPGVRYYNLYGPTETNVYTYYEVQPSDLAADRTQPVPIGRACGNMEVFALDDQGALIREPGKEGELCARGSCVAQGYWGDREKSAKSFVQNPLNPLYPDIIYRTGDVVTLAADRINWLYVGRRDHMIKSRGYRVELGEIETALYKHDQVKEAAAVAIPDELLGSCIRCFVVLAEGSATTAKELEGFCAKTLPKYMVPEKIELRGELPKTSSGKVDRPNLLSLATTKTAATA
ncbi:MAG: amino acid adenylation domain-containing protein [Verrucomicrobia bacterium]|nr:amino acid adenylation domain-containing protein [Verrucomicrobiota bacterium]